MTLSARPGSSRTSPASGKTGFRLPGLSLLQMLVLLFCAAAIGVIWLATLQRTTFERAQAVAAAMRSNANLAIALEQQVARTLKEAEQIAVFARQTYLRDGPRLDLARWAEQRTIRDKAFTILSIVDETGAVVTSTQGASRVNYADRDFFTRQRDNREDTLYLDRPVLGRISGEWRIPMSLRIQRPDGGFGGVVVLSVDPANFATLYGGIRPGPSDMLEIAGLDGALRSRLIGARPTYGLDSGRHPWNLRQATQPEGSFVDDGDSIDGVTRIISYRTMSSYPLMITVGTDYAEVLAPARQRRETYLLLAGGATAALAGLAVLFLFLSLRQRTATEVLEANEALFRATFHQAAMGIARVAPDGRLLEVNEKFCRMLGYEADELLKRTLFDLVDPGDRDGARAFLNGRLTAHFLGPPPEVEKPYRRRDGSLLWVCEALSVVRDAAGLPDFLVAVVQDITARKNLETRLSHDALHDALTGLPNRVMFQDRCARALEAANRHNGLAAVLYLDLDGFKEVNDSHGHAMGDILLQQVARRLEHCVRAGSEDTASRFGGDEFGIVLAGLDDLEGCERVARTILEALARPFDLADDVQVRISASIGAAIYPRHGQDPDALVAHADAAMYAAKHSGKNRFRWEPLPNAPVQRGAAAPRS
ncbi:diguanylate cyclase/phosphodiesterase [Castellaniella defragrans 65Phen]|uniref:Diguanylate cyclase/phosphodiesterase n=1 Tax=Castellaniella defragrans (strain DSM 12143 / CCUG 39792 / 65Phen) TaxID=1437824 RepID=W8X1N6_CASD6|nr:diguanylate cyclase [Castellaniella defragrans]CDM23162.1 diguanylate cyclase/phosphodiesterase [Castellaniella defragrans 65Phen]